MNRRNQRIGYERQEPTHPQWPPQGPVYFDAAGQPIPPYQVYYDPYTHPLNPYAQPLNPYAPHLDPYYQQVDPYAQQIAYAQHMQYSQGGEGRPRQGGGRGRGRSGRGQQSYNETAVQAQEAAQLQAHFQGMGIQEPRPHNDGPASQQAPLHNNGFNSNYATSRRSSTSGNGKPPVFALDVECVATGPGCRDREVAQIGVVDEDCQVVLNLYVKPQQPIVSYLTALTGLTKEVMDAHAIPLEEALAILKQSIPENAVLVSYNIDSDLDWLHLEHKVNRGEVQDLKGLYSSDPKTHRRKWKVYGQDHIHRTLIGETGEQHDAVGDAIKSMRLLHLYNSLKDDPQKFDASMESLANTEKKPSFAMKNPIYDGVCMGNREHCRCFGGKGGGGGGGLWVPPQPKPTPATSSDTPPAVEAPPTPANGNGKAAFALKSNAAQETNGSGSAAKAITAPKEGQGLEGDSKVAPQPAYREVQSD